MEEPRRLSGKPRRGSGKQGGDRASSWEDDPVMRQRLVDEMR